MVHRLARNTLSVRSPLAVARRWGRCAVLASACSVAVGCGWLADLRDADPGIRIEQLKPPAGYSVSVFARSVPEAREMALGPAGVLFVTSGKGSLYALTMSGERATQSRVVLDGLDPGVGVAYRKGALFVSTRTKVLRYDDVDQRLDRLPTPATVLDGLPKEKRHSARFMAIGPDDKLYVSVGSPCNVCESKNDDYGIIVRVNADGSGREIVARGIRNTVGFDWHPRTRELWFTDNGQDELGTERPNDELNRVSRAGEHFGFPYCHDRDIADPEFGKARLCSQFTAPAFGLGAHVAALGMRFYSGAALPQSMHDSIIIARHGSHPPIRVGYDVVRVALKEGGGATMTPFLEGFLQGRTYWGRPADVLVLPDASVLVSDDLNGAIYRVAMQR